MAIEVELTEQQRVNCVVGMDSIEDINQAIMMPEKVKTEDGRVIHVKRWETATDVDEPVSVVLVGIVELPKTPEE